MVTLISLSSKRSMRGFSLVELSIVLAIVAFILGAVWMAAAPVWENRKVSDLVRQMMTVANNIKDYYVSSPSFTAGVDITASADCWSLLPGEMRVTAPTCTGGVGTGGGYATSFGGAFNIVTSSTTSFVEKMQGLTASGCVKFLMDLPNTDATTGIQNVYVNNSATPKMKITSYTGTGGTPVWNISMPTIALATGWCSLTSNEVDVDFRLHP